MIITIQADLDRLHKMGLLNRLLEDKTTKANIIWATDAYSERGEQYRRDAEITSDLITGDHSGIIKTRARKELEQRSERTRQHAEVFTPLWVCDRMNNDIDEVWFGTKDMFNAGREPTERIVFPEEKDWKQYVDSRRLEITCGEAPYLVSRYDVESGEMLPIKNRIGILDRKLRVVNENAADDDEWRKWAIRAMEATYGYEFQGDNLLIARTNLVMTFAEYYRARFGQEPDKPLLRKIVNIVSWNIWQMNGLTDKVPFNDQMKESISLFDQNLSEKDIQHCKIYDWRRDNAIKFFKLKNTKERSTKDRKEVRSMKFDYIIGNPPYQEEQNGRMLPMYDKFMDEAYKIADVVELITPGRFLFNAGQTSSDWNEKMLSDPHFSILKYEESSGSVFSGVDIKGGVAISLHDNTRNFGAIGTFIVYEQLRSTLKKVRDYPGFRPLSDIIFTNSKYALDVMYKDHPDYKQYIKSDGKHSQIDSVAFAKVPIFLETKPVQDSDEYIRFFGRCDNKRAYRWVKRKYIVDMGNIDFYKVLVSSSSGSGKLGEALSEPLIGEPRLGYTQSFLGIGAFRSENEADACMKYIKTKFCRAMWATLKITQHNPPSTWANIPLQNFTSSSDIDWSRSVCEIDQQLYKKYKLTDEETAFIESHVKEMA